MSVWSLTLCMSLLSFATSLLMLASLKLKNCFFFFSCAFVSLIYWFVFLLIGVNVGLAWEQRVGCRPPKKKLNTRRRWGLVGYRHLHSHTDRGWEFYFSISRDGISACEALLWFPSSSTASALFYCIIAFCATAASRWLKSTIELFWDQIKVAWLSPGKQESYFYSLWGAWPRVLLWEAAARAPSDYRSATFCWCASLLPHQAASLPSFFTETKRPPLAVGSGG